MNIQSFLQPISYSATEDYSVIKYNLFVIIIHFYSKLVKLDFRNICLGILSF